MKILAIMGSPRKKGNTYKLTRKIEEEMKALGKVEFEYLFLQDINLKPCKGCFVCISKGEDRCPLKDDERNEIVHRIMDADGIILASPVYVMHVTWLMKILVDRLAYLCHRPEFFKQKAIAVSTTGGIGLKETLDYIELVAGGWGMNVVDKLGIETPPWPKTANSDIKNNKKIQKTAHIFYKSLETTELPKPNLMDYMRFRIVKEMSHRLDGYLQADYQFYNKLENYYYNTKISIFKKLMGKIMLKIGFYTMRDNFVEK